MKKVLLTLVLAFTGIFAANAQVWLGGSLAFNTNKYEDTRGTYYFLGPEVGYSFGNWSVATALGYSSGINSHIGGRSLTELSTSSVGETNTTLMEKSHTAEIYKRRGRLASSLASPSIPQRNGQPCSILGLSATAKVAWAVLTISPSPMTQALVLISQHRQPHSVCTIISDRLS